MVILLWGFSTQLMVQYLRHLVLARREITITSQLETHEHYVSLALDGSNWVTRRPLA